LWDRYPLAPTPEAVPSATVSVTVPAAADPARRSPAAAEPAAGTGALVPLVALGIVLGAAAAVVVRRRRRPGRTPPATAPGPAGAEPPATAPAAPPDPAAPWNAEIGWSAEGGSARFLVVATRTDTGADTVIAASPALAWPPAGDDAIDALTAGADRLEAALLAAGWIAREPGSAWYARRFGWAPVATPARRSTPPPEPSAAASGRFVRRRPWPAGASVRWRCEIGWEFALRRGRFRVLAYPPGGEDGRAIGRSVAIASLPLADADPKDQVHRQAVRRLAVALQAAGWEPAGQGARWYASRFVWSGDGEPPELPDSIIHGKPAQERAGGGSRRHGPA